jgi:hypothetical protein
MVLNHLINQVFYFLWKIKHKKIDEPDKEGSETSPLFIGGMFRSGTSMVTKLLIDSGFDAGPKEHLLQAKGKRKALNPNGFFENFLFMEWSMLYMKKHGVNGASLKFPQEWKLITETNITQEEFARFCILVNSDDRISNMNKLDVLIEFSASNMDQYLKLKFREPCVIKNPHFSLFFPVLFQHWPKGKLLLVFQDPYHALFSVNSRMLAVDPLLYNRYYQQALKVNDPRVAFFSLDNLLNDPGLSVKALSQWTGKNISSIAPEKRKDNKAVYESKYGKLPEEVLALYENLKKNCINPLP